MGEKRGVAEIRAKCTLRSGGPAKNLSDFSYNFIFQKIKNKKFFNASLKIFYIFIFLKNEIISRAKTRLVSRSETSRVLA